MNNLIENYVTGLGLKLASPGLLSQDHESDMQLTTLPSTASYNRKQQKVAHQVLSVYPPEPATPTVAAPAPMYLAA